MRRIQVYDTTGIVTYTRLMTYDDGGKPRWTTFNETRVFVFQDGAWKMAHFHSILRSHFFRPSRRSAESSSFASDRWRFSSGFATSVRRAEMATMTRSTSDRFKPSKPCVKRKRWR